MFPQICNGGHMASFINLLILSGTIAPIIATCGDKEYLCDNNKCIEERRVCDGRNHCSDGTDELGCSCLKLESIYCDNDDRCIELEEYCEEPSTCIVKKGEKPLCESQTLSATCGDKEYLCDNNKCIEEGRVCDGKNHCSDGTDELGCSCLRLDSIYCDNDDRCIELKEYCVEPSTCIVKKGEKPLCGPQPIFKEPPTTSATTTTIISLITTKTPTTTSSTTPYIPTPKTSIPIPTTTTAYDTTFSPTTAPPTVITSIPKTKSTETTTTATTFITTSTTSTPPMATTTETATSPLTTTTETATSPLTTTTETTYPTTPVTTTTITTPFTNILPSTTTTETTATPSTTTSETTTTPSTTSTKTTSTTTSVTTTATTPFSTTTPSTTPSETTTSIPSKTTTSPTSTTTETTTTPTTTTETTSTSTTTPVTTPTTTIPFTTSTETTSTTSSTTTTKTTTTTTRKTKNTRIRIASSKKWRKPDVKCNMVGTKRKTKRTCYCKENVMGKLCNKCAPGYFSLHEKGCIKCFCMNLSPVCKKSNYFWREVVTKNFRCASVRVGNLTSCFNERSRNRKPYKEFDCKLPVRFSGEKITSYGGRLRIKSKSFCKATWPIYVFLKGRRGMWKHNITSPEKENKCNTISVKLIEQNWKKEDDKSQATRDDLMLTLYNLTDIWIRILFNKKKKQVTLKKVSLQYGHNGQNETNVGSTLANEVEECVCPHGHTGSSCQSCSPDYQKYTFKNPNWKTFFTCKKTVGPELNRKRRQLIQYTRRFFYLPEI